MRNWIFYFEIMAAIAATISFKYYKNSPSRYFLYYLWFVVLVESLGYIPIINYSNPTSPIIRYLGYFLPEPLILHNFWIMNIYDIVTYNFYIFYFFLILKNARYKQWTLWLSIPLFLLMLYNFLFNTALFNTGFYTNYVILGAVIIFILSVFYFENMIASDSVVDIHRSLPFWIISGTLIFQLAGTPIFIFSKYLGFTGEVYVTILSVCNFIMYGLFIFGFIIKSLSESRKKGKYPPFSNGPNN